MNKLWRIYRYKNVVTGQSYIGQTTMNINDRAAKGCHYYKGSPFRNAIEEYGWDAFEQSILRLCVSQEEANYYEKFFIDKYNTIYPNGYNRDGGGQGKGKKVQSFTEEHRKKISEALKEKPKSEEHKRKISESLSGCTMLEEHKRKISESQKGYSWFNNGIINIHININTNTIPEGFVKGMIKR